MTDCGWKIDLGEGPLVATAIHDGHDVRPEVLEHMVLSDGDRRREEDPHTALWTRIAPTKVIVSTSRFEVDLNRPRDKAVYRSPEDAWGLKVWRHGLPDDIADRSLRRYDRFYRDVGELFRDLSSRYGRFLVYDLHSYNQRREGPDGPAAEVTTNPQVNVGTGTMGDRSRWAPVIDAFIGALRRVEFPSGNLDVRENVKFRGGQFGRWTHAAFPDSACVLSIELKKFFMDEWSGRHDPVLLEAIEGALLATVPVVMDALAGTR